MQRVPVELITDILGYLPDSDVRSAASVDTQFYRAAQDAGCFIHITVDIERTETVTAFEELVQHATSKPACERPGIALRLLADCPSATENAFHAVLQRVLHALGAAMPLLVRLEAYFPSFFAGPLHHKLRAAPAPRVRRLALGQFVDAQSAAIPLPVDLFAHTAKRLRTVCLAVPTLDAQWQPVTAFRNVLSAQLKLYRVDQPIRVARFFPRLLSLVVDLTNNRSRGPRPRLELSGLDLKRLTIGGKLRTKEESCVVSGVDIIQLPVFECGEGTVFDFCVWETAAHSDEPMTARFERAAFLHPESRTPAVTLQSGGCTRTAFDSALSMSPIGGAHDIAARLTVAVIGERCLSGFLSTEAQLVALTELVLNVTVHHGLSTLAPGKVHVRCPALKSIALFSRAQTRPLNSDRVAKLGEMLNVGASRAILKMVRVAFIQPVALKRLARVFPVIEYAEELSPALLRIAEPRDAQVEDPFFVPVFVVRRA